MIKNVIYLVCIIAILVGCNSDISPSPTPKKIVRLPRHIPASTGTHQEVTPTNTSVMLNLHTATTTPTGTAIPKSVRGLIIKVHDAERVQVVLEGDRFRDSYVVRLIGVSASPKTIGTTWANIASDTLNVWLMEKVVHLAQDETTFNLAGELPRYIYLEGNLINQTLIELGMAKSHVTSPDTKFETEFKVAENAAHNNKVGLWGPSPTPTIELTPTLTESPIPIEDEGLGIESTVSPLITYTIRVTP